MGRALVTLAHFVTIIFGGFAAFALFSAIARSAGGENAIGDMVLACTLVIVPYCIAGSFHRIAMLGRDETPPPA